jgi:hypothetical protein
MRSSGDGREIPEYLRLARESEQRHVKRLALSRLWRLMNGLLEKNCPSSGDDPDTCYWCGAPIYTNFIPGGRRYVGDFRGQHKVGCPWSEVIDWLGYQTYLEGLDGAGTEEPECAGLE